MTITERPSVLVVHEHYQHFGGEDVAVEADLALLEGRGHRVAFYERHNDEIKGLGPIGKVDLAVGTVWSGRSRRALAEILDRCRPDVVHVHNTFPMLSPAIYRAATERRIPVVQTIHNYRLVCAAGTLLREGKICTDCIGRRIPLPAVKHACYHGSRVQSAVVATMQTTHRAVRTWDRHINLFLPVSQHTLDRLVEAGAIPPDRAMVRRNHVSPDPGTRRPGSDRGYAAYAGRLSVEKGVDVLVRAAALVPELPVRIIGDGPEQSRAQQLAQQLGATNVAFLGRLPRAEVNDELRGARCLVSPSICEEAMGVVLLEAAALGVPMIGSNIGGTPEAIVPGTGLLFPPGDVPALGAALRDAAANPEEWGRRGIAARRQFETEFSAAHAYETLLTAYGRVGAIPCDRGRSARRPTAR